jgi:hypothetical protein
MGGPNTYRLTFWSKPTYMRIGRSLTGKLSRGVSIAAVLLLSMIALPGQSVPKARSAGSSLREHYDAAQALQERGDLMQAAFQYKLFLGEALHRIANGRAQVGEYPEAVPLFDEALTLTLNNTALNIDYAEAPSRTSTRSNQLLRDHVLLLLADCC